MAEGRRLWEMKVVGHALVDPRTLTAHPDNPKTHPVEQDVVVEASLRELGWLKSIVVNTTTGRVLDGHERLALALRRGMREVPVEYVALAAADEGKALMLLDATAALAVRHAERWAKLAGAARTEEPVLRGFWERLGRAEDGGEDEAEDGGIGRESVEGRADGGLDVGASAADGGAERTGALQAAWETGPGQWWQCGEHLVVCGDSTLGETWAQVRARVGGPVQGCLTSPPYATQRAGAYGGVAAEDYVAWMLPVAGYVQAALAQEGSFFLNLKEHSAGIVRPVYVHALVVALVEAQGWVYLDEFCWERYGVPGDAELRGKFKNQWEPIFWLAQQVRPVFYPGRARYRSADAVIDKQYELRNLARLAGSGRNLTGGPERRGEGWAYPGNRLPTFESAAALGHPAAFPVGLAQFFVEVYSDQGDWWVDPFGGSGSTLMACERTGRKAVLIERDAGYVAITLGRYAQASGERPQRVA
jgi:site-specific DNA-methyltransferase (adenine-specific)